MITEDRPRCERCGAPDARIWDNTAGTLCEPCAADELLGEDWEAMWPDSDQQR